MSNLEQARYIPRPSKAQEVRDYVRQEINDLRAGKIERLSTFAELNTRFGYKHYLSIGNALRSTGLLEERRVVKKEAVPTLDPSTEWAWMIGLLSGGGHVRPSGTIHLGNPSPEMLEAFKSRGERLFKSNARIEPLYGKRKSPTIIFGNLRYTRALGNFTRDACVNTIREHHDWILMNDRYIWSFLEGFFEIQGNFYRIPRKKYDDIYLLTIHRNVANFLTELLVRVGIEKPGIKLNPDAKEGIDRVRITSLKDVKHFSEHIHSVVPQKEERLVFCRNLDVKEAQNQTRTEDAIYEWSRVTSILGHIPSSHEIAILKKLRLTKYSSSVYAKRFGRQDNKPNFGVAKETLSKILESQTEKFEFDENEIKYARSIFEANKPKKRLHIPAKGHSDDDVILEWIRLTTDLGHTPSYREIVESRKQRKTKYSPIVYISRFGLTGEGKSFVTARNELIRITSERTRDQPKVLSPKRRISKKFSDEEIVIEWIKIKNILGDSPSYDEVLKLHRQGSTSMSYPIYLHRFGGGSWVRAREVLERIVFTQDVNNSLKRLEEEKGIQIRYVSKIHRQSEKDAKKRLDQLVGWVERKPEPRDLVGPNNQPIYPREVDRSEIQIFP